MPRKIVIAKCPDRVEHSGPNHQINDYFQPDGKISSNFLAQTYLSKQLGETTSAEFLVFSVQFFWMRDRTIEATLSSPSDGMGFIF